MIKDFLERHALVEIRLELVIEDRENDLHSHVQRKYGHDDNLSPVISLLTSFQTLLMELVYTAAFAQAVVNLSYFIE